MGGICLGSTVTPMMGKGRMGGGDGVEGFVDPKGVLGSGSVVSG